jgi:hydrogenase maturation protease
MLPMPSTRTDSPGSTAPTLVLALGNPQRGDDGAGPAVLERLASEPVPDGVELLDGGLAGLETALHLQNRRRAIILDAADFGAAPGAWRRVSLEALRLVPAEGAPGLHAAGLREALLLGDALGILPAEVVLFLIQPRQTGWEAGLSEDVLACLEPVCQAVRSELSSGGPPPGDEGIPRWPTS